MVDNEESIYHILYRHYDADDVLLYVGVTNDPYKRTKRHFSKALWGEFSTKILLERYPDRESVLAAEVEAIHAEYPVFNITGTKPFEYERRIARYLNRHDRSSRVESASGPAIDVATWLRENGETREPGPTPDLILDIARAVDVYNTDQDWVATAEIALKLGRISEDVDEVEVGKAAWRLGREISKVMPSLRTTNPRATTSGRRRNGYLVADIKAVIARASADTVSGTDGPAGTEGASPDPWAAVPGR